MKTFLSLLFIAALTNLAPAAPYIVYSGVGMGSDFSASGAVRTASLLYLITDLADTSSYTILQVDTASNLYTINSRPSASPTTEEANNNFLGGITTSNLKGGIAVLSFSNETTDSNSNTYIAHAYATGPLTLKNTTLVRARTRPLILELKSNGAPLGTYTFSTLTPAVTTGSISFPMSLSGVFFNYEIASGGALVQPSSPGTFSLVESPVLTELANIGGAYVSGRNSAAVLPISISNGSSVADAYSAWLAAFAQLNGYTLAGADNQNGDSGATLSLGNAADGGASLTLSGTINNGSDYSGGLSVVTVGTGTLMLNQGATLNVTAPTAITTGGAISGDAFAGVLTLGGSPSVIGNSGDTTLSQTDTTSGDSGVILTLNTGTLTLSGSGGTGTLGSGGGLTGTGSGENLLGNGATLVFTNATVTVSAVNNGLVDGTIASASLSAITFTGATLLVDGVNSGSTLTPGAIVTGSISLAGGSLLNTGGVLTDTGSTFTITTTP